MTEQQLDEQYREAVAGLAPVIGETVDFVTAHPELAHQETETAAHLVGLLRGAGYTVTEGVAGMATAFRAELDLGAPGATVGVIAVYDAPASYDAEGHVAPVHSCGHGPQSAGVIGAALALAAVREQLTGRVVVVGCPADEIHSPLTRERGSGKALTAAAGVWDDVDVVLYPHPEFIDTVWPASLAMRRETARVVGVRTLRRDVVCTPLVALANVTALAGAVDPARLIIESVSVDGDVEEGAGMVFEASFLLFADDDEGLDALADTVHGIVGEAVWTSSAPIAPVRPDPEVIALVGDAFAAAGREFIADPPALGFATDFGNVTRVARAALVGVGRAEGWRYHTPTGAEEFAGAAGVENAVGIAEVIGLSAIRIGAATGL
ncbi:M20/M25/M40 family metallo-hydrolase [Herbiconiux sp. CPCC 205716]|uniref:M20/M25/M40 family metallo-hydrolase n=1 Tax=Herbiconiux gentiana TaxID=2970912 RepID=A0ABT2GBJ9_9MICO|nr:M20/M25/M40 family metallo-hydrolase [Herbiconiux gentiana]MCS5713578.1 M20/M25/M40 family metallo-hydrolase [Herbiconiux gentiana]